MSKTIRHEKDNEAKADKRVPHHRRARQQIRISLARIDIEFWYRENSFVADGEPKPRGWWTG